MKFNTQILKFFLVSLSIIFTAFISNSIQAQVQIYANGFESAGGFYTDTINNIWERGIPQKAVIDTAHSGQNVWLTDLDSAYQGAQNSFLYSPQIVIAPFDSGYISFWQFVDLDTSLLSGKDICSISYRKGADTNWFSLGYQGIAGATNWFNANSAGTMGWHYDSSGWFNSSFPFYRNRSGSYFYQVDTVQFRFSFRSYANHSAAGWAIDDFGVYGWNMPVDLGIMDIVLPQDSTTTGSQIPVRLRLKNYGLSTINSVQCSVLLNNSPTLSKAFSFTNGLLPDSTIDVDFTNTYMAPNQNYELTAIAKITNDYVIHNDTFRRTIISKAAQYDLAVTGLEVAPSWHDTTRMTKNTSVTLKLKNCGYDTIKTAVFSYKINATIFSTETWNGAIAPNDTSSYQFNVSYKGQIGVYTICGSGNIMGETYLQNNTYCRNYYGLIPHHDPDGLYEISIINNNLKIYPNPTQSIITIDLETLKRNNILMLSIYNSCGKEVKHISIAKSQKNINIDISKLSPGLYYILLQNEQQVLGIGKFIKE